jgi:carbohydrate-selective porin OprB
MDSLIGVHGLKLYLQYKTRWGRNGSGAAAFVQNFSNIDADDFHAFGEAWIEQRMLQDKLRIKAGRLDFNSEFAGTDNGAAFLNASMGFSPSITAAPTFPLPVTAFNVIATPNDNLSISAGIFDGLSGAPAAAGHASLFQIAQATELWTLGGTGLSGRAAIGAWRHTGVFAAAPSDSAAGQSLAGTRGWYATLDQTLWRGATRTPNDDSNRARIAAYAQFGHSDPHVEAVHVHQGGGMTFTGMLSARPSDLLGVGTTRAAWANGHELIGEVFYQFPVTSHLSFVADLQHVNRWTDGTDVQRGVVATWRTILTF